MSKLKDITGQKFGRLIVIERLENNKYKQAQWRTICECGEENIVPTHELTCGNTKSCGCLHTPNMIGKKFGKLTVLERAGSNKFGRAMWNCRCDCGQEKLVSGKLLRKGLAISCGCYRKNQLGIWNTNNSLSKFSPETLEKFDEEKLIESNHVYCRYQRDAEERNLDFNLSRDEFIIFISSSCFYCGLKPDFPKNRVGIDRIDNNKNYELINCVSCCEICNRIKMNLNISVFLNKIELISKNLTNIKTKLNLSN